MTGRPAVLGGLGFPVSCVGSLLSECRSTASYNFSGTLSGVSTSRDRTGISHGFNVGADATHSLSQSQGTDVGVVFFNYLVHHPWSASSPRIC